MAVAIPYITLALAAAGTGAAVQSSRRAGQQAQVDSQDQARAEADNARGRELERRRALVQALSSQAAAGAGAVGAYSAIARRDIKDATNDLAAGSINSQRTINSTLSRGRAARRGANAEATTSLLSGLGSFAKNVPLGGTAVAASAA